jgi:hypothetical protein
MGRDATSQGVPRLASNRANRPRPGLVEVVDTFAVNVLWLAAPHKAFNPGGLAQLGERLAGSQKVRGSSPLSSIRPKGESRGESRK